MSGFIHRLHGIQLEAQSIFQLHILKVYDENYFRENVIYNFGIEKIVGLADVKITRGPAFTSEQYTPIKLA